MSVLASIADGCQRVLRAPALVAGLWLTYVFVPAPLDAAPGDLLMALIDAGAIDPMPALLGVVGGRDMLTHAVLVTFLLGGVIDRLARDRATATFGFFGAAGMFFFRFVRLSLIAVPLYAGVLLWVYPSLPAGRPVSHVIFGLLIIILHVLFDFARVRMVVEDRRSAIGALVSALRFVRRNAGATLTLSLVNGALAAATWWLAATFAIGATAAIYPYLLARALLRLIFIGSATSLFQRRLAHAGYAARPLRRWPDSPAAEAVLPR
jgi:hypothetical protein